MVSRDKFWRVRLRQSPAAAAALTSAAKIAITIHEDTDGDGTFDKHKTFVDGLNIATSSVAIGRGGVWVLNPPYLLFYPDKNDDDVPDGDPDVHLEGFGLEDTHSVANSLHWGPDGWLYAAQGSTVTAHVKRPGSTRRAGAFAGPAHLAVSPARRSSTRSSPKGAATRSASRSTARAASSPATTAATRAASTTCRAATIRRASASTAAVEPVRVRLLPGDAAPRGAAVHAHVRDLRRG